MADDADDQRLPCSFDPVTGLPAYYAVDTTVSVQQTQFEGYQRISRLFERFFGLSKWREGQLPALRGVIEGRDVLVLMPPGRGKSLIYQLAGLYHHGPRRGANIVISPLVALIRDQVDFLRGLDIHVACFYSDLPDEVTQRNFDDLASENPADVPKFVFLTPEFFERSWRIKDALQGLRMRSLLARFVIDEAQCVVTWGNTFRESYKYLSEQLRQRHPGVPILALSASLGKTDLLKTINALNIRGCDVISIPSKQSNLHFSVQVMEMSCEKKIVSSIVDFIRSRNPPNQTGIIYCITPSECNEMQKNLTENGISSVVYHGTNQTFTIEAQNQAQNDWASGKVPIIIATDAFGLGINKIDVRFVIHKSMPKDLNSYYQQTGRAGRDGKPADCVLYYDPGTYRRWKGLINHNNSAASTSRLYQIMSMCLDPTLCRREYVYHFLELERCPKPHPVSTANPNHIRTKSSKPKIELCGKCDVCIGQVGKWHRENLYSIVLDITDIFTELRRQGKRPTLNHLVDGFYKGQAEMGNEMMRCRGAGAHLPLLPNGRKMKRGDVWRILHMMLVKGVFTEEIVPSPRGPPILYVIPGPKFDRMQERAWFIVPLADNSE